MERQEFETIVDNLGKYAAKNPSRYRLRVVLLSMLGYAFVAALIFFYLGLTAATVALLVFAPKLIGLLIKVLWILPVTAFYALKSLWVSLPPPSGRIITRKEAPELFAVLEQIQQKLKSPRVNQVLVTDEFNAGVTQVPRLGLFGFPKNYLCLGFPLMASFSPEQFQAVIAHELGHLNGEHGRMSTRIYQQRVTWSRLQNVFAKNVRLGSGVMRRFLNWYAPYFNAYSFVLARRQEFEADQAAVTVAGKEAVAEALTSVGIAVPYQDKTFWKTLIDRSRSEPVPSQLPFGSMFTTPPLFDDGATAQSLLQQALARKTDVSDTHPALTERLAAIEAEAMIPNPHSVSAAQKYLGATGDTIAREFDEAWKARNAKAWRDQHDQYHRNLGILVSLDEKAAAGALSIEDGWQRLLALENIKGGVIAQVEFADFLAANPDHLGAKYAVGRLKLADGDETGLALLREVIAKDEDAIKPAAEIAHRFLKDRGRNQEAVEFEKMWWDRNDVEDRAQRERSYFNFTDTYLPAELSSGIEQSIRDSLRKHRVIRSVMLVKKKVQYFPERPVYLLYILPKFFSFGAPKGLAQKIADELQFDFTISVVIHNSNLSKLKARLRKVKGAQIYKGSWI